MSHSLSLQRLGWRPFFSQQLTLDDVDRGVPGRVNAVHRSGWLVLTENGELHIPTGRVAEPVTVGDWLMIEHEAPRAFRLLDRQSLLTRLAAGTETRPQP